MADSDKAGTDDTLPRMSGLHIRGTTTARGKPNDPQQQLAETPEELEKHAKQVVGMLLFDEHKDDTKGGEAVGVIRSAHVDADGRLEVDVEMADTLAGWKTLEAARRGDRVGFSWSRTFGRVVDPEKGPIVAYKRLNDLSIVQRPEFEDDALIHHIDENSKLHEERKKELFRLIGHAAIDEQVERIEKSRCGARIFVRSHP